MTCSVVSQVKNGNIQMLLSALILHDAADGDIKPD